MVDKTDYASLETSLASNFTIKRIGVNHGSAAADISTLSRTPSKVGSGIYRLSLEANACNYDYVALRIAHASAATQVLVYEMATYDDTDQQSLITIVNDIASDAHSAAAKANSQLLVNQSTMSDVYSLLSSRVTKEVANASQLLLIKSNLSDVESAVDDVYSLLGSRVTKEVANASQLLLMKSNLSDVESAVDDVYSLLGSRVTKEVANASQLLLVKSLASDAHSAAAQANSRALVIESTLSDIDSALTSQFSDIQSRVPKEVGNASQLLLMKSTLSDTHSAATEARKILRNKMDIDSATGAAKLYDDDGTTVLLSGTIAADGDSTVRGRLT